MIINESSNFKFEEQVFEWKKITQRELLSGIVLEDPVVFRDSLDFIRDSITAQFNAYVLGQKLPEFTVTKTAIVETPATPWDHFKQVNANKWWMRRIVKRRPVKMTKNVVKLTATWQQWAAYPWQDKVFNSPNWKPVRVIMPALSTISDDWKYEKEETTEKTER